MIEIPKRFEMSQTLGSHIPVALECNVKFNVKYKNRNVMLNVRSCPFYPKEEERPSKIWKNS